MCCRGTFCGVAYVELHHCKLINGTVSSHVKTRRAAEFSNSTPHNINQCINLFTIIASGGSKGWVTTLTVIALMLTSMHLRTNTSRLKA